MGTHYKDEYSDKEEQIPDNLKLATIALLTNVNCRAH